MGKECECGCGHDEEMEEMTSEELAYENNIMLNALIDMLIEKGVISEEEFEKKVESMEQECEEGSPEDDKEEDN